MTAHGLCHIKLWCSTQRTMTNLGSILFSSCSASIMSRKSRKRRQQPYILDFSLDIAPRQSTGFSMTKLLLLELKTYCEEVSQFEFTFVLLPLGSSVYNGYACEGQASGLWNLVQTRGVSMYFFLGQPILQGTSIPA